jgi:hypothetical protein
MKKEHVLARGAYLFQCLESKFELIDSLLPIYETLFESCISYHDRHSIDTINRFYKLERLSLFTIGVQYLKDKRWPFGKNQVTTFVILLGLSVIVLFQFLATIDVVREVLYDIL